MITEQAFLNAASIGDKETFLRILNNKSRSIDPNCYDQQNNTALILATNNGHNTIVSIILDDTRTNPNQVNTCNDTALICAAIIGHTDIANMLLNNKQTNPNTVNTLGRTALIEAADRNHSTIVSALLSHTHIDLNLKDKQGHIALVLAARKGHSETVSTLLTDTRIDPNHSSVQGITALILAAAYGHSKTVSALLTNTRTDLNLNNQGQRALLEASARKHITTLETLLLYSGYRLSADTIATLSSGALYFYTQTYNRIKKILQARFRGLIRAMVIFKRRRLRAAMAVYTPGATGFVAAAASFKATSKNIYTTHTASHSLSTNYKPTIKKHKTCKLPLHQTF